MSFLQRDPRVSFGRICVRGTGIPVSALVERRRAGETLHDLACDYGLSYRLVSEALREYQRRFRLKIPVVLP